MPILKAKINGVWTDMGGINEVHIGPDAPTDATVELWADTDDTALQGPADEVWVGTEDPRIADPLSNIELWYDVDAVSATTGVPRGGAADQALIKVSATDGDMRWGGNLNVGSGEIQFANETGPKINLYSTTFGLGVESGTTTIFASGTVSFHQNSSTGARWAFIDGTCGNGRVITEVTGDARYQRTANSTAKSGFLSLGTLNLTGSYASVYNTPISYPSGNRRIKVTVQLKVVPGGEQHILIKCFGQETSFTKHNVLTDTIGPAVFVANGTGTSQAVNVEVKSDTGNGSIASDGSSWVLVEDLGPR